MDVGLLEIPAELAALLQIADDQPAVENRVAEVSPPQVKAVINLSLPPDVNNFPFSKFIHQYFQVPELLVLNHPIQQPFTHLQGAERHAALELFKLVLRFLHDEFLQGRKEVILGNFIAQKGIANPTLRNEIFCQVVNQTWKNPDMEEWQRACLLLATCLSCLQPSAELEKPLLKYVSDHAMEEYRALCQHKALSAMQQDQGRSFPPTQLEWTANRRRGQMVLDVHLLNEETVSTEVESWTTGEELASWILKFRGQEGEHRGWAVSLHTGEEWRDMIGCDFVMDLISETEELGFFPAQSSASVFHSNESHPDFDSYYQTLSEDSEGAIPPAPDIQAPSFPPVFPSYEGSLADVHSYSDATSKTVPSANNLDNYVNNLFDPVFSHAGGQMERPRDLSRRMKGGGGIGPSQTGGYMATGAPMVPNYSMGAPAMPQVPAVPAYQTVPLMQSIPTMQSMPTMQSIPMMQPMAPTMPAIMVPQNSVPQMAPMHQTSQYSRSQFSQPDRQIDSSLLTAQQQTFINQQALLLAQQMTMQAMSISQQQQQEQQQKRQQEQKPISKPPKATTSAKTNTDHISPAPPQKPKEVIVKEVHEQPLKTQQVPPQRLDVQAENDDMEDTMLSQQVESFQQKRAFFLKLGKEEKMKATPPAKILFPKPERPERMKVPEESKKSEEKEHKETPPPAPPLKQPVQEKDKDQSDEEEGRTEIAKSSQGSTRPEPSQNIREIIKMYQSQPKPPPPVYQPIRRLAKPFLKKNDPKDEALSLLGMKAPSAEGKDAASANAETQPANVPPKAAPKPQDCDPSASRSIQDQLTQIFSPSARPPIPAPPPPPPPAFGPPSPSGTKSEPHSLPSIPQSREAGLLQDENINTNLYRRTASVYFSYINIPWRIYLRKELFYPRERFNTDYILNLMCEQIIRDTYSDSCVRISKEERCKMRNLLAELHVGPDVMLMQDNGVKKRIIVAARDNWAVYFSRLFSVSSDIGSNVEVLSVSHRGIKLLKTEKAIGMNPDHYKVLQSYSYVDIQRVTLQKETVLELVVNNEQLVLYSVKAKQAKALINLFLEELQKDSTHVVATKSYITDDKSLLNFRKGDIIKLQSMDGLEPGWQFGSNGGRSGLFPIDHTQLTAAPDYYNINMGKSEEKQPSMPSSRRSSMRKSISSSDISEKTTAWTHDELSIKAPSPSPSSAEFGQYVMTEFAMSYFRESVVTPGAEGKNLNHLIQHTKVPIQESLLYIVDKQLNELAAKNFMTLMRFMGDEPLQKHQSGVDCIQSILQLCKETELLRDEVCCQIIKQITDNPSKESCMRGWRILYLFLGFYPCSTNLRPFVLNYLADVGNNSKHDFQAIAQICQDNLQRTLKFGGRRHPPSKLELDALIKGRSSRRMTLYLPGKLEHMTKIRPFSVGNDILMEICADIGIKDSEEAKEFSLFAKRNKGEGVRPIRWNAYIFDFLGDDNQISLHFQRVTWKEPLHFHNDLYVNIHYNQVLPIYLKGQLLLPTDVHKAEWHTAQLAAYQHKTKGTGPMPNKQQLKTYLPKTTTVKLNPESILKQTIQELKQMVTLSPGEAKIHFLTAVQATSLFGYNVFMVKKTSEHWIPTPCILAFNQEDFIILNEKNTDELLRIPMKTIQGMRSLRPSDGSEFPKMEVKYGSSVKPQTISLEMKEVKEACHTISMILDNTLLQSST